MRELTRIETDQTGGGAGLVVVFLVAAGGSIAAGYICEKFGGVDGIKEGFKSLFDNSENEEGNSD